MSDLIEFESRRPQGLIPTVIRHMIILGRAVGVGLQAPMKNPTGAGGDCPIEDLHAVAPAHRKPKSFCHA